MTESVGKRCTYPVRLAFLCAGLIIMAFGVAFSIKAALGTSPISSVPYVTARISGMSVGTTTIIMNFIFVLIQIGILRNRQLHAAAEVAVARDADADFLGHRDFAPFVAHRKKVFRV